jgi:hypothetical protein
MCLPASGQISISQIRNEIYNGGAGCGPSTYSLGALAGYAGFPANPDAMSEFYNYCCNCNFANFCYHATDCYMACNSTPCTDVVTYWIGTLTVGTVLRNGDCTGSGASNGYYAYAGNCYTVTGGAGVVASVTSCPPPTTTTTTSGTTTTTSTSSTTTTTTIPPVCHNHQATFSGFMTWTDCCGVAQSQFLIVGDIFCAQVGSVIGNYIDLGTPCPC